MSMEEIIEEKMEEIKEDEPVESVERPYTLRKLKDADLFPLLKIFRKCGLKDFKDVLQEATDTDSEDDSEDTGSAESRLESIGIGAMLSMADVVIKNIGGAAKDDIYAFYSELSGIPAEEITEMEFGTLPLMIYDSFREVKNTSFFKVLSKLL